MKWAVKSSHYPAAAGDVYVGEWKADLFEGHGTITSVTGQVRSGHWERNILFGDIGGPGQDSDEDDEETAKKKASEDAGKLREGALGRRLSGWWRRRSERRKAEKEACKKAAAEVDATADADAIVDAQRAASESSCEQENHEENHADPAAEPAPAHPPE